MRSVPTSCRQPVSWLADPHAVRVELLFDNGACALVFATYAAPTFSWRLTGVGRDSGVVERSVACPGST